MADEGKILVVGSINMDLVVRSPHMPNPGETVIGNGFVTSPGGKGANQAVGVARMGGNCKMIGCVGKDEFGTILVDNLKSEGIDCQDIIVTEDAATGVAFIVVDSRGENSIVVASGANYLLSPDDIFEREKLFEQASLVLLQLELPIPTVIAAIDLAGRYKCKVILDPAPVPRHMPKELFKVDIISPNWTEAEHLLGRKTNNEESVDKLIASDLIEKGASAVVLKLGARGSMAVMADGHFYTIKPYKVSVVDTTAAGDAYTAALAVATTKGHNLRNAAKFANAAGALACTKMGAQSAMPTGDQVRMLMADQPM